MKCKLLKIFYGVTPHSGSYTTCMPIFVMLEDNKHLI